MTRWLVRRFAVYLAVAVCSAALFLIAATLIANAAGWESGDPELEAWFQTLPVRSCCDRRDAYLADAIEDDGHGGYLAIITDGSEDPTYNKPAIPNGTKIPVPQAAFRQQPVAPGGRGVIFLQKTDQSVPPEKRWVFCYFPPPGF